jgi:aspartyl-tRNA(Asn)/glutamyl-tRNA(Gln) amidotransferase subunit C
MSLTIDEVKRIAHLARIEVEPQEAAQVLAQLSGIFTMIGEMQAVNTDGVEPMSHAQDLTLRLRDDQVTEQDRHAAFQAIAPQVEADLYLVPKVIE